MEPTNAELMTHIVYIRQGVDELKTAHKETVKTVEEHTTDIAVIKAQGAQVSSKWGAVGGILGGLLSGFLSSKAAG